MNIYTSYFYQVRFFPPNLIPVSTAKKDPEWFHNFEDEDYIFLDHRRVCNGLRMPEFVPASKTILDECPGPVSGCEYLHDDICPFKHAYYGQLCQLDFQQVYRILESIALDARSICMLNATPDIALLVHEAPTIRCSEREVIQRWFRMNDVNVREWRPS